MFNLSAMPIKQRLYLGFGFILSVLALISVVGILKVTFISSSLTEITDVNSVKQRLAINYRGSVHDRAIAMRDVSLASTSAQIEEQVALITSLRSFYDESEQRMTAMMNSGIEFSNFETKVLKDIDDIKAQTIPIVDQIIEYDRAGNHDAAFNLVWNEASPLFTQWLKTINQFIDYQENLNQTITPLVRKQADNFLSIILIATVVALIIGFVIARYIINNLYKAIGGEPANAADSLSKISKGDLTLHINAKHNDSVLGSVVTMKNNLTNTVQSIVSSANSLSAQAQVVATTSKTASELAEQQSSLTQETSVSLETMQSRIDEIAQVAKSTEENSHTTSEYSKQGKEMIGKSNDEMLKVASTVSETLEQLQQLNSTTEQIGSIVNVISSISEQTNLLALNAAIEAARAGENGRGFAVVADEVRQLAKRTGDATGQIETMISDLQRETEASVTAMERTQPLVQSGQALTSKASELLLDIDRQAQESLNYVRQVAQAANQQVANIHDVSNAMNTISNMSAESLTALSENAQATEVLNAIFDDLNHNVKYFKIAS